MPFLAEEHVEIPTKDLLSWYLDSPHDFPRSQPIYINAENPSEHYTAARCFSTIRKLAAGFKKLGLKQGDVVCVVAFNSIHYPVIVNGIIGFGGVYTGCNPSYTVFELEWLLKSSGAVCVIVEPDLLETVQKMSWFPNSRLLVLDDQGRRGVKSWREVLLDKGEMDWPKFDDESTSRNTAAALLYSSGTTGLPKAAILSHYNLIAQQILFRERKKTAWKKRRLVAQPVFHVANATLCHFGPLHSGDQMFIVRRFDLENFLKNIERLQITEGSFMPPVTHAIISSPLRHKYSLKSIRQAHSGAAPLDAGSQGLLKALLPSDTPYTQVWGMTETSSTVTCVPYEEGNSKEILGAVGRMLPNMDVKLCDTDGKDITADDTNGEICVRGPLVISGYYLNPEANERDWDSDGYFHTGDIGYRDGKTKMWYIVDRIKEMIKLRGFQVSPSELEGVLLTHAGIKDACVIGVPARKASDGEVPRAYVIPSDGIELSAAEIHSYIGQRLARYKQLTGGVVIAKEVPKSVSGKKLRRVLVEQAKKEMASTRCPETKL